MAKKNISAVVSAAGFISSFWIALDKAVRERGGTEADIYRIGTPEGEALIDGFADMIVAAGGWFSITCKGVKTCELVKRGKYDWVNSLITDELFPIEEHTPEGRKIELVEFDHDPSSEEVLAEFARRGLERPTYEDALSFGIEHPEEQRKHPVVFLHEPVRVGDDLQVLVLYGGDRGRDLGLDWFVRRWGRDCRFAAVRK